MMGNRFGRTSKRLAAVNREEMTCEPIKPKFLGLSVVGKDYPVPLKEIDVKLTIRGFIANVVSTLKYKNTETNPIEAVFEFPLDDQSAVYQFEAQIEDRIIVAECQEKKQAKQTFDDAVEAGETAVLLEEDSTASDIFRCLVGNLPPATEAVIKFAYVIELPLTPDGAVKFHLPTQLNPRYDPNISEPKKTPEFVYVALGGDQPYTFTFHADIFNSGKIASVVPFSSKDELAVTISSDGTQAEVKLVKEFIADHELSLEVKYEQLFAPHVVIEKGDALKQGILSRDVLMLNFFPQLSDSEFSSNHEFIFLIDRSGSMEGPRIVSAQQALLVFLKSLPPGCYFNIIGFGSYYKLLFEDGSREYSEESLKLACEYQSQLEADYGGTEILEPLKAIYDKSPMPSHSRQLMLLTDGEVFNTAEVIDIVRKNASKTRVFSFGIGEGASSSLIKGVARAGRGKAEFVLNDDQTTALVMKTLKAAMQASVTDLELDWHLGASPKLVQVPRQMPPLFAGDRLIVYAINSGEQAVLDGRVELKGKIGQRVVQFSLNVASSNDTSPVDITLPVHRLAAKAEINHLQDSEKEETDKSKAEIVLMSIAANIVSRHTSMVGVDKGRTEKVTGDAVKRSVPLMLSPQSAYAGFGGGFQCGFVSRSGYGMPVACCMSAPTRAYCKMAAPMVMALADRAYSMENCIMDSGVVDLSAAAAAVPDYHYDSIPPPPAPVLPGHIAIIKLQSFIGCWKLEDQLAGLTGVALQQLTDSNPLKSIDVWATIVALATLTKKFADKKDEWEMIDMKARQWLSGQDLEGHSVAELITRAAGILP